MSQVWLSGNEITRNGCLRASHSSTAMRLKWLGPLFHTIASARTSPTGCTSMLRAAVESELRRGRVFANASEIGSIEDRSNDDEYACKEDCVSHSLSCA